MDYKELKRHLGHDIECVAYDNQLKEYINPENPQNVSIECNTCSKVLIDFDRP